jgi:hypothetical protein
MGKRTIENGFIYKTFEMLPDKQLNWSENK